MPLDTRRQKERKTHMIFSLFNRLVIWYSQPTKSAINSNAFLAENDTFTVCVFVHRS